MNHLLAFLTSILMTASALAGDGIILTADTPWVVPKDSPEALQRALFDVQRDWYKVFGHRPIVLDQEPQASTGPVIHFGISKQPGPSETFRLLAKGRSLTATGVDMRGSIYAAYALSERILGVDPWYYWTDHEPAARQQIVVPSNLDWHSGEATFRYRGWFINDEDLLHGFALDPLRENPYSLEMLDRICETILRLRGNIIVPGTFNFPDERCWELASRRGLVLNMHHILVVGLNTFRWPENVPFSYTRHPDIMEKYWRDCIQCFKGREVVWTVGYRGKHDQPFWTDEPQIKTQEERGAVMTRAIARQVELIHEVDPHATIIANLWMEGSDMMHAGHLKLPDSVIQVWPDNGFGRIRDEGRVKAGQGIYYHTAMLNGGANQLSEMVPPSRIHREFGRFAKAGATRFLLVNTSDIRPVPLSTDCAMRLAWKSDPDSGKTDSAYQDEFLLDWCSREFGEAVAPEVASIYARYFDLPYQRGDERETCRGDNHLLSSLRLMMHDRKPDKIRETQTFAAENRPHVASLLANAETLAEKIPAHRRSFYESHILTQLRIHLHLLEILDSCASAVLQRDASKAELALRAFDPLTETLRRAQTGKWSAWYFGEILVGIERNRDIVRTLLAELRGEPAPLVREPREYEHIYSYQLAHPENFPRFYPHGKP